MSKKYTKYLYVKKSTIKKLLRSEELERIYFIIIVLKQLSLYEISYIYKVES